MKDQLSQTSGKPFPVSLILSVAALSSAAWYDKRPRKKEDFKHKPGPKPRFSDEEVTEALTCYFESPDFVSEGYIKICKRLRNKGVYVDKNRLYKLMREANLLIGTSGSKGSGRQHDGTIITQRPNEMWATDGKEFQTQEEGKCWFIGVIDHFNDEIMSHHLCSKFDRYAAMEPLRQAVKREFGSVDRGVCHGLGIALRSDHGSQFYSVDYQKELKFFGVDYSPAFVRSPECNGIIERFHRTLNQQIFNLHYFKNLQDAKTKIAEFIDKYNNNWILHRTGLRTPVEARAEYYKQDEKEL